MTYAPRHLLYATAFILAAAQAATAGNPVQMKPGKWQLTMRNEEGGKQTGQFSMVQCMSAEELGAQTMGAGDGKIESMSMQGEDGECSYQTKQDGNTSIMESRCGKEVTHATLTVNADNFSMRTTVSGGDTNGSTTMEGKRIGECG